MKNILIIGVTGSVGAYTALHLKELGFNIIGVGRRETDNGFFKSYGINYYSADITQKESFSILPKIHYDAVVHLAGDMPSKMKGYEPQKYIDTIVTGTLNVLDFCKDLNISKIIFTQTRADSNYLMGGLDPIPSDIEKRFPLTGDHSIYAICKNAAVDLIEHYHHEFGIKRFVLRLPTIYVYHPNKYFYVNGVRKVKAYRLLIDQAIRADKIEIWGDPKRAKEIVYVKDLVKIIELAIQSGTSGGMYNVGRGEGVTIEEQIRGIVQIFSPDENKSEIIYRPDKPDTRQFIHNISKTKKDLGYIPQYNYIDLLKDFKREMEINQFEKLWGTEKDYE